MPRYWTKTVLTALMCLMPAVSGAQGRTAGQIVGTVKDASGEVVPKAEVILIDNGTGTTTETRSGADGGLDGRPPRPVPAGVLLLAARGPLPAARSTFRSQSTIRI